VLIVDTIVGFWQCLSLKFIGIDASLAVSISSLYGCRKAKWVNRMATVKDLVEDWIEIRSTLQRQLETLESGQLNMGTHLSDTTKKETIIRIKRWIDELNALLKEYARA
jgi:hypothetical protein